MKVQSLPLLATSIIILCGSTSFGQGLPAVNMGKWVHQPGDNQYGNQTQQERHGMPAQQAPAPVNYTSAPQGWTPTPAPRLTDTSLLPIPADEPVAGTEFPPLPEKLDLPIQVTSWGVPGGGYAGSPGRVVVGGPPQSTGTHQHYSHYEPGAFAPQGGGGTGPGATSASGSAPGQSHGYYKAREVGSDYYSSNQGGPPPSSAQQALRGLGKEPKLGGDTNQTPDAPQPVVINQSTTQDLSLPDDDFQINQRSNSSGRSVGTKLLQGVNMMRGMAGSMRF